MGKKKSGWLGVKALARVEAMSEDPRYPIKSAFEEDGHGWRAVEIGEQTIQLVFDEPRRIQRIWLCFSFFRLDEFCKNALCAKNVQGVPPARTS
jgi:hypothetical protein